MQLIKRAGLLIILSLLLTLLAACADANGELASKEKVLNKVNETTNEKYELISIDRDTESVPKVDIYHFKSKERDMYFDVISTLRSVGIDESSLGYEQWIMVGYADGVRSVYKERIDKVLEKLEDVGITKDQNGRYYYSSFDELEEIVRIFVEVDNIYKEELQYNSADWLLENPYDNLQFSFVYKPSADLGENNENEKSIADLGENEKSIAIFGENIDGSVEYNSEYERIASRHTSILEQYGIEAVTIGN